jgi:hypothetical protein
MRVDDDATDQEHFLLTSYFYMWVHNGRIRNTSLTSLPDILNTLPIYRILKSMLRPLLSRAQAQLKKPGPSNHRLHNQGSPWKRKGTLAILSVVVFTLTSGSSPARAGKYEEYLLNEKPIREEAARLKCDDLFRLIMVTPEPYRNYSCALKIYLTRSNGYRSGAGRIYFKLRLPDGKFLVRNRSLNANERDRIWKTVYDEEIFSLPTERKEIPVNMEQNFVINLGQDLCFEHWDKHSKLVEQTIRYRNLSGPANRVATVFANLVADFLNDLDQKLKNKYP